MTFFDKKKKNFVARFFVVLNFCSFFVHCFRFRNDMRRTNLKNATYDRNVSWLPHLVLYLNVQFCLIFHSLPISNKSHRQTNLINWWICFGLPILIHLVFQLFQCSDAIWNINHITNNNHIWMNEITSNQ